MHLAPQHFQTQSRYVQDSIDFVASAISAANYGVVACELSDEALENGQVVMIHGRGVFPDGLVFHMPDSDPAPPPRGIADKFSPTDNRLTVYLAVPPTRPDGWNVALEPEDGTSVRFIAESQNLHDETTGRDEKPVRLGRKNIRFLFENEPPGDLIRLPIARVTRSGSGRYIYDPRFIPPCLDITASSRLMSMLQNLLGVLQDRGTSLALSAGEHAALSFQELTRFWFLHAINSGVAPLRHLFQTRRGHPEQLFIELSRLGGALCTFALDSHPRNLPSYDHQHLETCFDELDMHIRRHLEIVIPTGCIRIALKPDEQYFFSGEVADQRCLGNSTWILAIQGGGGDANVIGKVPGLVKVCSKAFVPQLVKRALPGFELTHAPTPPSAVAIRPGTQYFLISKAGPCWEHIIKTREVGVYIPGEFPDAEPELLVAIDSSEPRP
jgi:type VI secretion system protein ImpJ